MNFGKQAREAEHLAQVSCYPDNECYPGNGCYPDYDWNKVYANQHLDDVHGTDKSDVSHTSKRSHKTKRYFESFILFFLESAANSDEKFKHFFRRNERRKLLLEFVKMSFKVRKL